MMTIFEMIKYHKQTYPSHIPLSTEEIPAHFDSEYISSELKCSLHTEYSYGKRRFDSKIIQNFPTILNANKDQVPQLWKSATWANEFADFIFALTKEIYIPEVIEIHPPFDDYIDMDTFIKVYTVFENKIKNRFPDTSILIENRCGSVYRGGRFLISTIDDLYQLAKQIETNNLSLKIAYDIPQIYTAYKASKNVEYLDLLKKTSSIKEYIGGVHLWGKKLSPSGRKVSHCGNLNTYFGDIKTKELFLNALQSYFNDNVVRKMVLEVNSGNDDLMSIICDLENSGIKFV